MEESNANHWHFTRRDKWTILFWIIFIASIVIVDIELPFSALMDFAVNVLMSIVFGKLMFFRKRIFDMPHMSRWCCWGWHKYGESTYGNWMKGTGKFIGHVEIKEQRRSVHYKCTRENCNHSNNDYY